MINIKVLNKLLLILLIGIEFTSCTNKPPTCTIFSPSNGDEFFVGDNIEFVINANDDDGKIASVEIVAGSKFITTLYSIPFVYEWDTGEFEPGEYTISVTVIDDKGDEITATVTIVLTESIFSEFTDSRDGKTYKTIKIGDQVWMAENLAFLPEVSPSSAGSYTEPYYYVYDYQGSEISEAKTTDNYEAYGVLYNWPAACNSCPSGWHLPSDDEWKQLEMYIGMGQSEANETGWRGIDEGEKLKTTYGWDSNGNGNNEFGFSALPGGLRDGYGIFCDIGERGIWWSASEYDTNKAWMRSLSYGYSEITRFNSIKKGGISIHCIKNN